MKEPSNSATNWLKQLYHGIVSLLQPHKRRTKTISHPKPNIIPRDEHPISRKIISRPALNVLYGLKDAGYEAYLVGGCLRDALTGTKPKDFDVVTNARPEEIQQTFKRARIIGRRFRLVHVYFGRDVIEVATFRSNTDEADPKLLVQSKTGQLLRDNVFGTIEEDAQRRDFTINALYYNIADFALYDFTNALEDIKARTIRLIGDPETRYREDPVRMLRAVRFSAKLGFTIEQHTAAAIKPLAHLLKEVPPARLFDECNKLFLSGHGERTFEALHTYGLFAQLFPHSSQYLQENSTHHALFLQALRNTDERLKDGRPVTPAFLFAVFLWPLVRQRQQEKIHQGMPPVVAMNQASSEALSLQAQTVTIPKRFSLMIRDIWDLQERLPRRHGKRAARLVTHPRFRAAYDFLLLREAAQEIPPGLGQWWTDYQDAEGKQRETMVRALNPRGGKKRPRRRPRKRANQNA